MIWMPNNDYSAIVLFPAEIGISIEKWTINQSISDRNAANLALANYQKWAIRSELTEVIVF